MSGENKSNNIEIEFYINQIAQIMIRGIRRRSDILQYIRKMNKLPYDKLQETGWIKIEKCDKMIDIYVKRAKEMLREINEDTLQDYISYYACQLEDLYREARRKGHLQTANNIMKNKMYLRGVGGFNIHGNFDIKNFDLELSEKDQKEYNDRIENFLSYKVIDNEKK